jgi:hypothetical protein
MELFRLIIIRVHIHINDIQSGIIFGVNGINDLIMVSPLIRFRFTERMI